MDFDQNELPLKHSTGTNGASSEMKVMKLKVFYSALSLLVQKGN
jgi:hypothetical protein